MARSNVDRGVAIAAASRTLRGIAVIVGGCRQSAYFRALSRCVSDGPDLRSDQHRGTTECTASLGGDGAADNAATS